MRFLEAVLRQDPRAGNVHVTSAYLAFVTFRMLILSYSTLNFVSPHVFIYTENQILINCEIRTIREDDFLFQK